ncbi:MAG: DUF3887 domain-containing protein [Anaerolineaceae bacterium]|nr:DUF3887 domain-containing protein [Anaerolineaceae bacterium]MBN2676519.1 DUF3887 domain-containing protein [Anaerolineaceae bacterium]
MRNNIIRVITLVIMFVLLGGCAASPHAVEGSEREAVLAYSEQIADNILNALNENDYEAFVQDYDENMLTANTPENFANLKSTISLKLGKYLSREVTAVTAIGDETILVVYSAAFEKEKGVTIRLAFQRDGDHLVTGIWLDSPLLRQK